MRSLTRCTCQKQSRSQDEANRGCGPHVGREAEEVWGVCFVLRGGVLDCSCAKEGSESGRVVRCRDPTAALQGSHNCAAGIPQLRCRDPTTALQGSHSCATGIPQLRCKDLTAALQGSHSCATGTPQLRCRDPTTLAEAWGAKVPLAEIRRAKVPSSCALSAGRRHSATCSRRRCRPCTQISSQNRTLRQDHTLVRGCASTAAMERVVGRCADCH